MAPSDPDTASSSRRPLLIAAVLVVLVVAGLAAALWLRDDSSDSAARSSTAEAATSTTATADPDTPDGATPTADGSSDGAASDLPVELTPVSGDGEAEICAAIVARLEEYRDAASNGLPSQELIDALDEFEAQVDTQSDDQDWGDRIVEQTTNVRREWVTALSAERDGDAAAADDHNAAAVEHLDQAIDDAACPTA